MSLIEHDKLVETFAVIYFDTGEDVQHNDEQAESIVFFNEFITKVHNNQTARAQDLAKSHSVIDILFGKTKALHGQRLLGGRKQRGRFHTILQVLDVEVLSVCPHDSFQLSDVGGVVSNGFQKEHPVLDIQVFGMELNRKDLNRRILLLTLLHLIFWSEHDDITD